MAENETNQERGASVPRGDLSGVVRPEIDYAASVLKGAASTDRTVTLQRSETTPTPDQALWVAIRNRTDAISFSRYAAFIDRLLCCPQPGKEDVGAAACGDHSDCVDTSTFAAKRKEINDRSYSGVRASDIGAPSISDRIFDLGIRPSIYGVDAYHLLKLATQAFLIFEAGIVIEHPRHPSTGLPDPTADVLGIEEARLGRPVTLQEIEDELEKYLATVVGTVSGKALPYLKRIVDAAIPAELRQEKLPYCQSVLRNRFSCPSLLELIWSYWHEEGLLVQTLNAIALRFQNRRGPGNRDPLANLEIDPLRPLNNLLWGFIQDEYNRLTVPRRAYEYDHHYGLTLVGKAVPRLESADSRSKFIEAFHNLLYKTAVFFREDADTTVIADAFPLLNALKEVHLLLAEGAHNQFGDLPWTARAEMLLMQWLLARPEIRAFLYGRVMVPYQEPWMGVVDTMKKLQGWTDTTVTHFHELAVTGERILLSVRYGDWVDINNTEDQAKNWARYWKPEIQRYIHAYQTVTGVDLAVDITDTRQAAERYFQPSAHLQRRLIAQRAQGRLPAPRTAGRVVASEVGDYVGLPAIPRRPLLRQTTDE